MKRKIELLMGLCVILCAFVLARKGAVFVQSEQAKSAPVCIVVDAGHGGDDPGKIGINDALEKDINLQIALKLQKILEQNNIKVVMTRNTDAGLYSEGATNKKAEDMQKRCKIIEDSNALFTVSIHQNSYTSPEIQGAQVFYYGQSETCRNFADGSDRTGRSRQPPCCQGKRKLLSPEKNTHTYGHRRMWVFKQSNRGGTAFAG